MLRIKDIRNSSGDMSWRRRRGGGLDSRPLDFGCVKGIAEEGRVDDEDDLDDSASDAISTRLKEIVRSK